jgi:hypothetical protein
VLCWRDRRPERGRTDQAKMHCQVYPRRSWCVDHENICSKYTDLFSEPQLERKDGRNASSVRKGPVSLCLRAAVLRLLPCRLSWKETEVVTSTGEEEGKRCRVASDCTVETLSLRRRIYSFYLGLRATRFSPVPPGSRARSSHEGPTFFSLGNFSRHRGSQTLLSAEKWLFVCHAEKTCLGCHNVARFPPRPRRRLNERDLSHVHKRKKVPIGYRLFLQAPNKVQGMVPREDAARNVSSL